MRFVFSVCLLLLLWGCKKDKTDFSYNGQPTQSAITSSPIRIVNIHAAGMTELIVNDQRLTSFLAPGRGGYTASNTRATKYFPENGRMGTTFYIPQEMIKQDGKAQVTAGAIAVNGNEMYTSVSWEVNEHTHPFPDYYVVGNYTSSTVEVPRSISPPANPQHFKIRLLNLAAPGDLAGLEGPMSLAWADGSQVSDKTNAIEQGRYSEYIELPYGSYQFKVLDPAGRPLPAQGGAAEDLGAINPETGTTLAGGANGKETWLTYAPIRSYQPGGIYTIVVSVNGGFRYLPAGSQFDEPAFINSFRIISDISDPVNISYARIQAVNAMPGKEITVLVDEAPLPGMPLSYTAYGDYSRFIAGTHRVKVRDAGGNTLAEQEVSLNGSDNITIWVYEGDKGQAAITVAPNNLSSAFYMDGNNVQDGTNNHKRVLFPQWMRFLNLCPAFPEVTFTREDGLPFVVYTGSTAASQHLLFGKAVQEQPYVQFRGISGPGAIYAFASTPGILPGNWIKSVPVLKGTAFIARPEWYPPNQLPASESGVYTVALVGSGDPAAPASHKPKMIIVKHNQ